MTKKTLKYYHHCYFTLASLFDGGRFPHALLIAGPDGSGKRTLADFVAAHLMCTGADKPCGNCTACKKIASGNHPDIYYIDGKSTPLSIKIDQVRALIPKAYVRPHESEANIFIIANAHNMRIEAQNALLKILEEPPKTARFILTAHDKGSLLETVASRLVSLSVPTLEVHQRQEILAQRFPEKEASLIAAAAVGGQTIGQCLSILENDAAAQCAADAQRLVALALEKKKYALLTLLSPYAQSRESALRLFNTAYEHAVSLAFSPNCKITPLQCKRFADILKSAQQSILSNVSLPLIFSTAAGELSLGAF